MSKSEKISLEEAFQIFTVAELKELCKTVEITGVSSKRKADIIKLLVARLMDKKIFAKFCFFAEPKEMKALEHAFSHPVITEEEYEDYYYWLQTGYCFMEEDEHVLVMEEVKKLYRELGEEFWSKYHRFHQLREYMEAAIHLYGVTTLQTVVTIFNQWNEERTTEKELLHVAKLLEERADLMDFDIEGDLILDEILLDTDNGYFAYEVVFEQQGAGPYYIPEKEQYLAYAEEDYFEKTKEYQRLLEYLTLVYGIHKVVAEDMCEDIQHSIHLGYVVEDIMCDLENKGVIMDPFHKDDLANLVLEMINHTRSIFHKGFTPEEAGAEMEFTDARKRSRKFLYTGKKEDSIVIPFPGNHH